MRPQAEAFALTIPMGQHDRSAEMLSCHCPPYDSNDAPLLHTPRLIISLT
jgi:hypothetical protein